MQGKLYMKGFTATSLRPQPQGIPEGRVPLFRQYMSDSCPILVRFLGSDKDRWWSEDGTKAEWRRNGAGTLQDIKRMYSACVIEAPDNCILPHPSPIPLSFTLIFQPQMTRMKDASTQCDAA